MRYSSEIWRDVLFKFGNKCIKVEKQEDPGRKVKSAEEIKSKNAINTGHNTDGDTPIV